MAATYPAGIKAFPTYVNGDQVTPTTINDPNAEVTAIETGLIDGLAHDLVPDLTGNQRNLGTPGQQWYDLVVSHNATIAGTLTVTGGLTGTTTFENLVVTGNLVISSGSLFVNGPILGAEYLALRGNRAAGQAVLTVENDDAAGLAALFRATTGAGIIVQLQDIAQVPRFDLHADGSMNTSGNLTIAGNATIGGTLTVTGGLTITGSFTVGTLTATTMNVTGPLTVTGLTTVSGLVVTGGLTAAGAVIQGVLDVRSSMQSYLQAGLSVGTTPTTIYTATRPHSPADVGGLVLVNGTKSGDAGVQFLDVLAVMSAGAPPSVIAAQTKGAAEPRLYAWSGLNLQLSMFTSTYKIHLLPMLVGGSAT